MKWPSHGSNPKYLYDAIKLPVPERIIDFSANINPLGPPMELKERWNELFHAISDYPDPAAADLKRRLSDIEQIDTSSILIGNGGAELISMVARMLARKRILILQPTFSEYEKACKSYGCRIDYHLLAETEWGLDVDTILPKLDGVDAIFLCNPNNPTGVHYPFDAVIRLIKSAKEANCRVILDEAFYDMLTDYETFIPYVEKYENLIILRSMTKMFAIPGLRLGYMVANPEVIHLVETYQTHWSVNTPALTAGEICLQDPAFQEQSRLYISEERRKLFSFFRKEKFSFSPSAVNFYLLKDPDFDEPLSLLRALLVRGFVPRHTFNFPGLEGKWLRFAIRHTSENNELLEVLKEWKHHQK